MALGSFLRSCCHGGAGGGFRPYFLVEDDIDGGGARQRRQIILSEAFIRDMETTGYFDIEPLVITTAAASDNNNKHGKATSISLTLQMEPYSSGATTSCAALPISGFPRRLITEESGGSGGGTATAKAVVAAVPAAGAAGSSVLVSEPRSAGSGGDVSADSVSAMSASTSPRPLSPDSVSPVTTYTLASRSSTGSSAPLGPAGFEKQQPRRHGEGVIAELPDHGSQAAELPSS